MKLFNSYKITDKPLPDGATEYQKTIENGDVLSIKGDTFAVDNDWFASSNKNKTSISLNQAFVRALETLVSDKGAVGVQKSDDNTNYVMTEMLNNINGNRVATAYSPATGKLDQCNRNDSSTRINGALQIDGDSSDGVEVLFTILAALKYSDLVGGNFKSQVSSFINEFDTTLQMIEENHAKGDMYAKPMPIYKLQDIVMTSLKRAMIPYSIPQNFSAPMSIAESSLKSGFFAPTTILKGSFEMLKEYAPKKYVPCFAKELKDSYKLDVEVAEKDKVLIPDCSDKLVSEHAMSIIKSIHNTPMRCFMLFGPAGTGKSTDAKVIAHVLGIPYYFFTCSDGTDETDIISRMIPNTSERRGTVINKQLCSAINDALQFDPPSALEMVTGEYREGIDGGEALYEMFSAVEERVRNEKDFIMVPSTIVEGSKKASIVEIQEVALVSKQGVLPALNALLDDSETIYLSDGTSIKRDPNAIYIFTTNNNYKGCKPLNESVKSRNCRMINVKNLSDSEMVNRLIKSERTRLYVDKNGVSLSDAKQMAKKMASTLTSISNYAKEQYITGGVHGYREFENWFFEWLSCKDVIKAAESTIVSHISEDEEMAFELIENIKTKFAA